MTMNTAHETYDGALTEALDRNTHRRRKQNVAIFLAWNVKEPLFIVKDCAADYRPEPPRHHNPVAQFARVGFVDRQGMVMEAFVYD